MSRPTLSIDFGPEIQAATATHTVSELSRASGVPRTTVRRMIARGNVPSLTVPPLTSGDWSSIVKRVQYLGGRTTRLVGPAPDRGPIELQITPAIIHQVGPVEQAPRTNADAAAINRNRRIADRPGPVEAIEPQPLFQGSSQSRLAPLPDGPRPLTRRSLADHRAGAGHVTKSKASRPSTSPATKPRASPPVPPAGPGNAGAWSWRTARGRSSPGPSTASSTPAGPRPSPASGASSTRGSGASWIRSGDTIESGRCTVGAPRACGPIASRTRGAPRNGRRSPRTPRPCRRPRPPTAAARGGDMGRSGRWGSHRPRRRSGTSGARGPHRPGASPRPSSSRRRLLPCDALDRRRPQDFQHVPGSQP